MAEAREIQHCIYPQQRSDLTTVVSVNLVPFYVTLHIKNEHIALGMDHCESFLPIGKASWTEQSSSDLHCGTDRGTLPH